LLSDAAAHLVVEPDQDSLADMAEIRIIGLIRQGRFAECGAAADAWQPRTGGHRLSASAYVVWINAACGLACAGDFGAALALAERAVEATNSVPVLLLPCLAAQAHLLARLGRHPEAARVVQRQLACASRLDSADLAATAEHDAGLVALAAAGRHIEAAERLGRALADGARVSRPAASLARAEALARIGSYREAARQVRAAALEPVGPADQPWALVPRMSLVQGLIAAGGGDAAAARSRFEEAVQGWRRALAAGQESMGEAYLAAMVDLGRPPVVGLVEPVRELDRIQAALAQLGSPHPTEMRKHAQVRPVLPR
jgi:tetratricopeptide (TPR) repeat protein